MSCTVEYPCSKRRETRKKNSFKTETEQDLSVKCELFSN